MVRGREKVRDIRGETEREEGEGTRLASKRSACLCDCYGRLK